MLFILTLLWFCAGCIVVLGPFFGDETAMFSENWLHALAYTVGAPLLAILLNEES